MTVISPLQLLFLQIYPILMPLLTVMAVVGIVALSRGKIWRLLLVAVPSIPVLTFLLAPHQETTAAGSLLVASWPSYFIGPHSMAETTHYILQYAGALTALIAMAFTVQLIRMRLRGVAPSDREVLGSKPPARAVVESRLTSPGELAAFFIASLLVAPAIRALLPAAELRVLREIYSFDSQVYSAAATATYLTTLVVFSFVVFFAFAWLRQRLWRWMELLGDFRGRASRRDFWLRYWIPTMLVLLAAIAIDYTSGLYAEHTLAKYLGSVQLKALLLDCWFVAAVLVKRCHDINRSGWLALLGIIPIFGTLWLLVLVSLLPGTQGSNRFGSRPDATDASQETHVK